MGIRKSRFLLDIEFFGFVILSFLLYLYQYEFYYGNTIGYIVADSKYYIELSEKIKNLRELVGISLINKNLLGPLLYFDIFLGKNRLLFFLVTYSVFIYSINELYKNMRYDKHNTKILFFLFINPAIITSFSGPNKEITGFISVLFIVNYIIKCRKIYVLFSLLFALFTRFELIIVIILFLMFVRLKSIERALVMISLMILVSVVIYFFDYTYQLMLSKMAIRENSLGMVRFLGDLSKNGLFPFTFLPKLLLNLFGDIFTFRIFGVKGYGIVIYLSQILFLYMLFIIVKKKRVKIQNDFFFFFYIYSLVFVVPSFVQHRYFVPCYPILVFMAYYRFDSKKYIRYQASSSVDLN